MYAIVRTGGRQYRAEPGRTIDVERLPFEEGDSVELTDVLLVAPENGEPVIGRPTVEGAIIKATVVSKVVSARSSSGNINPKSVIAAVVDTASISHGSASTTFSGV